MTLRTIRKPFKAPAGNVLCVDTEGTGLDLWHGDRPFAVGICNEQLEWSYVEWPVNPRTRVPIIPARDLRELRRVLEDESITKVFHNAMYDVRAFSFIGIKVKGPIEDTMVMSHVADSGESRALKPLCKKYLGVPTEDESDLKDMVKKIRSFISRKKDSPIADWKIAFKESVSEDGKVKRAALVEGDYWLPHTLSRLHPDIAKELEIDPGLCKKYCVSDVKDRAMPLYMMYKQVLKDMGLEHIYRMEMELQPIVREMESRGVRVHRNLVRKEMKKCDQVIAECKAVLIKASGNKAFNPNSPPQRQKLLFDTLGLDPISYTQKKHAPQTDKATLEAYSDIPAVKALSDIGKAKKARNTYLQNYLTVSVWDEEHECWVIHPSFRQLGARTGRFSCADPNLQNVPKEPEDGEPPDILDRVRAPFGPRKGYVWLHLDYSQVEARIMAALADETRMKHFFAIGKDVYLGLAEDISNRIRKLVKQGKDAPKQFIIRKDKSNERAMRNYSKSTFLGKIYGMLHRSLARRIKSDEQTALDIIETFDTTFPKLEKFASDTADFGREHGCVYTLWGRRVPIDFATDEDGDEIDFAYRGVNYIDQGSAADLLKMAMINIARYFRKNVSLDAHLVMQIHDELVIEIREDQFTKKLVRTLCKIMSDNQGKIVGVETPVTPSLVTKSWDTKKKLTDWIKNN